MNPLRWSDSLFLAGREHCEDMGKKGSKGLYGSNGSSPFSRIQNYGSVRGAWGQSMYYGKATALETVLQLFINDGYRNREDRSKLISRSF